MILRRQLWRLVLCVFVYASAMLRADDRPAASLRNSKLPTIFIAGDSTAAKDNPEPLQGWGEPFRDYFDPAKVNIANRARGGRSSRTFITEGLWDALLADVKSGDFVLIQFGHNDSGAINAEPPGSERPLRARGSLPGLGDETEEIDNVVTNKHEVVHTFGWYVRKMIADTKAKGATPILLSPTVRNIWEDGRVERGVGRYRAWDRELAKATGIPFVDVTRIAADAYQAMGQSQVAGFFPKDHTHTNADGARHNAVAVVSGLRGLRQESFESYLSDAGRAAGIDRIGWLNLPEPADPALPTLWLIGDSTVRNGAGDGADGQWGWGDPLSDRMNLAKVNVVNRAVGGLSSRTFRTEGHWARVCGMAKRGDFVVMQFGHNDAGPLNDEKRARGTIAGVGEKTEHIENLLTKQPEDVHSYGWYLRQYIRDARSRGLTPIVCSPIPRKNWKEGKVERSAQGYAGWAKRVAHEEGVAFIDLNELIAARYEQLGSEKVEALFADAHTHTSRAGAEMNAAIVADALRELSGEPRQELRRLSDAVKR
jgi:lysophospholipase L1-like esterase